MTAGLLLDEHYSGAIADELHRRGHDVVAVVTHPVLQGASDPEVFRWAAENGRRIVTENIKDFRPLLLAAIATDEPYADLLLVPLRRFPRGRGDRNAAIVGAIDSWIDLSSETPRSAEEWLIQGL